MSTPKKKIYIDPLDGESYWKSEASLLKEAKEDFCLDDGDSWNIEVYEFIGKKKLKKKVSYTLE